MCLVYHDKITVVFQKFHLEGDTCLTICITFFNVENPRLEDIYELL